VRRPEPAVVVGLEDLDPADLHGAATHLDGDGEVDGHRRGARVHGVAANVQSSLARSVGEEAVMAFATDVRGCDAGRPGRRPR